MTKKWDLTINMAKIKYKKCSNVFFKVKLVFKTCLVSRLCYSSLVSVHYLCTIWQNVCQFCTESRLLPSFTNISYIFFSLTVLAIKHTRCVLLKLSGLNNYHIIHFSLNCWVLPIIIYLYIYYYWVWSKMC